MSEFLMGSPLDELLAGEEREAAQSENLNPYFMGKFEVTVKEWNQVLVDFAKKEIKFIVPKEHEKLLNWFYEKRENPEIQEIIEICQYRKVKRLLFRH